MSTTHPRNDDVSLMMHMLTADDREVLSLFRVYADLGSVGLDVVRRAHLRLLGTYRVLNWSLLALFALLVLSVCAASLAPGVMKGTPGPILVLFGIAVAIPNGLVRAMLRNSTRGLASLDQPSLIVPLVRSLAVLDGQTRSAARQALTDILPRLSDRELSTLTDRDWRRLGRERRRARGAYADALEAAVMARGQRAKASNTAI